MKGPGKYVNATYMILKYRDKNPSMAILFKGSTSLDILGFTDRMG